MATTKGAVEKASSLTTKEGQDHVVFDSIGVDEVDSANEALLKRSEMLHIEDSVDDSWDDTGDGTEEKV